MSNLDSLFYKVDFNEQGIDAGHCSLITENFSLAFIEWIDKNYYQNPFKNNNFARAEEDFHSGETFNINQLLELYKETI